MMSWSLLLIIVGPPTRCSPCFLGASPQLIDSSLQATKQNQVEYVMSLFFLLLFHVNYYFFLQT